MLHSFWDDTRRGTRVVGRFALDALYVVAKALEAWGEMLVECDGCRQSFQRKTLFRLYDIPEYADRYLHFCDACRQRLRQEHVYAGILDDERRKVVAQLNRAMERGLVATLTLPQWVATLNYYNWRCAYCLRGPYEAIEHFVPIKRGGGTTVDNCLPACKSCNSSKGVRHPDDIGESSRSPAAIARVRADLKALHTPHNATEPAGGTSVNGRSSTDAATM